MSVTVRDLVALPELGLRPVAGLAGLDHPVSWVHGSEVDDPTPWLSGGELLLTTGMRVTEPGGLAELCARLAAVDAAGIGFATGVAFDQVPAELAEAADVHRLAVLEVPYETPFVAIAKAVAAAQAAHQHAALRVALDSHRGLVHAALTAGGVPGVVRKLAELLGGWCVVTDPAARVRAAAPESAASRLGAVGDDLDRLRRGDVDSLGSARPGEHLVMHRLGAGGRSRGLLLAGRQAAFGPPEQTLVAAAVSLLGLMLEQVHAAGEQARRVRNDLLVQLLRDAVPADAATRETRDLGLDPDDLRVLVLDHAEPSAVVEEIEPALADRGAVALVGHDEGRVVALASDVDAAVTVLMAHGPVGVSGASRVGRLDFARRQALLAVHIGVAEGTSVRYADRMDAIGLLVSMQDAGALDVFVDRVLAPLDGQEGLLESLRAYLDNHGSWHAAATALGVHRHTLRARLDRVETLLGRSLDSPDLRLELGLALRAKDLLAR